ncbi:cytochrome P450 [Aulographum hederae CBS 113979]|uniref:Cytochrome P450 n=1 Tax=Aulographum hederae CBS 113979 TaxID=1176131 RepID=A0A6G1GJG6_9PEZI|nr:cytochrome P450 [Aulographum hederae CBS 113979]
MEKIQELPIYGFLEQRLGPSGLIWTAVFVALIAYLAATQDHLINGIEVVGLDGWSLTWIKPKIKFLTHGKEIVWNGFAQCKEGIFQCITTQGPEIFIPMRYANELKSMKDLSLAGFTEREFFPRYPGFEGTAASVDSTIVQDVVRIKLTQSLNLVTKDLCEETDLAVTETFGESRDWKTTVFAQTCPIMVARLSTRVFLGPEFARNEKWLKIATDYTVSLIVCSRLMKLIPAPLRPILHWVLPPNYYLRKQASTARKMIDAERIKRKAEREKAAAAGKKPGKIIDSLAWMEELHATRGGKFDFAGGQLGMTFAAIHTTSDMLVKCLYNMCERPEYFGLLREEMVACLKKYGWKKTTLFEMKLLDSFMKETQRLTPASFTAMNRVATADVTLSDGTVLPKNSPIKVMMDRHFSPTIYPSPDVFDGHRFFNLRLQPGQENAWQFVTTSEEHIGFGHGQHACPGRFFASNEIKIALIYLLLKYEWRFPEGRRPKNLELGLELVGDQSMPLEYKRRNEEVDLFSLIE